MKYILYLFSTLTLFCHGMIFAAPPALATTMELRDKIAQMLIIGFDGKKIDKDSPIVKIMEHENIGGVILF